MESLISNSSRKRTSPSGSSTTFSIPGASKTTYLRNEITNFLQKSNETFNEEWERFKDLLRQCPHHGFSELHQLDTFYNALNPNDQDALDSAAGGNFLDKIPRECLSIIKSKSKVRYSRSRVTDVKANINAPLLPSSHSNSFDLQQIAASLEDKLEIRMNRFEKSLNNMKNSFITPTAPLKAVAKIPACYDDYDDDYDFAITPNEAVNSLSMGDEHLDTILATKSDEFIKSSVENLVPNPSESVVTQLFFDEDFPKEVYLNPLFDEEIISMKIDPHPFNAKSDLIESLLNHDSLIISSSKIDSFFNEFAGELTLLKSISLGIDETDFDPEEETHFIKRLLYNNSSSRPPKEFVAENSDAEIDLSLYLLSPNNSLSLPENESFYFDIPSFSRPPSKPPDDSSEPSNDNTNVVNALREPLVVNQDPGKNSSQSPPQINHPYCYGCGDLLEGIFCHQCTCKLCGNGAHYGYNCQSKVLIIPNLEPFNNQAIKELPQTMQSFDPKSNLVYDSPNIFDPPPQLPFYSCEFCGNDARYGHYFTPQVPFVYLELCYNQDFNFPQVSQNFQQQYLCCENCGVTHEAYQYEFIKSSVENLVPNPSESEGDNKCDVPSYEVFTTFSNILFDSDYDFYSSDDQSFSDEDFPKEIFSNPLFDKEIISMKIDPHPFNDESDLIESLLNHDSSIISSSKFDSLFDEFVGELTLLKSIPLGIDETDCDPEEETYFVKRLLYDNSSPRPPKEFIFENSDAEIEYFSPSPIPVEDSDSLIEEIDLSFTPDYPMSPGIEEDDYDSERDTLILEELLSNNSLSLPKNESFHFDIPSFSRPPAKPPDGNTRILNVS
uniref:Reverse transcriptase domain-containing protein n=1 Tax=Tanacetum cinerariifolium TaxID=118510 RepID=A0A6L2K374_TANCI|nr:reverse transcriptase domain-containing protein [Tanacetum cinerariifolium]